VAPTKTGSPSSISSQLQMIRQGMKINPMLWNLPGNLF
jgi:hypothetical protein